MARIRGEDPSDEEDSTGVMGSTIPPSIFGDVGRRIPLRWVYDFDLGEGIEDVDWVVRGIGLEGGVRRRASLALRSSACSFATPPAHVLIAVKSG